MNILVLNCGSSSIKYQLFETEYNNAVLCKGLIEKIGLPDSVLQHQCGDNEKIKQTTLIPDHQSGINRILQMLVHPEYGGIRQIEDIRAVGHRVAHGGERFTDSVLINPSVIRDIEACVELAPLHNPANLKGILSIQEVLPNVPQVAVFDTSFHQTLPKHAYIYGIPYSYYEKYGIRKYGFHGTSHKYVANEACRHLDVNFNEKKIISCHLGNGASVTAIDHGISVETSMGFTPVEGLIMGTRCGDLDLGVLLYLMEKEDLCCSELNDLINRKSGMLGITGVSSDMRDIRRAANDGNERAKLGLEIYAYIIKKYIGAYAAVLNGVDIILFTGGIGENDISLRKSICSSITYLGIDFDEQLNDIHGGDDFLITRNNSKVAVMVVPTNEELVIARDTRRLVSTR
ncbi:MAG: acetate kinase [Bacteroidales bacterium]|nr:acetate kinase [Bacteroidales bacterium]